MQEMMRLLTIAAKSDIPVLLCGESGTGKEVAARKLHELSPRAPGPFIAVNCGALSAGLVESLFEGACRGAFTGAVCDRVGFVRAADGGTLFLDEIGELPPREPDPASADIAGKIRDARGERAQYFREFPARMRHAPGSR